jgi:regulatory protein
MANHEWSLAELSAKAEAYCAAAEHCIFDVRQKLQQWGANTDQIDAILEHLQSARFIDEQRYCHAFVHDKLLYQGWGRMKIRAGLQAKHLPSCAIDSALKNLDESEYFRVLNQVITSKRRTIKSSDPQAREKLIRFCLQRGFTYEEIRGCISD